ncbi:unnamed protein product [Closterium sp. Yama58-4]|nr:unnamed protein product [Closterium sp. Yama58-4]
MPASIRSFCDLVSLVSPEALSFVHPNGKACDAFIGQTTCLQLLEDLTCALTCNPDASAYVSATAAGTVISVCEAFAQAVMEGCQGIDLGEVSLSRVAPDPSSFMSIVAASVTSLMGAADVTITVDNTESCFNGTGIYPRYTACCDPLTIPPTCPPNSINSSYSSSLSSRSTTSSASSLSPLPRITDPDACMLGTLPAPASEPAPSSEPSPGLPPEPAPAPSGPVVYPACPFTGKPPTVPKRVPTRCPAAANKTCCADCSDLSSALRLVGTNLEDVVVLIDPSLVGFVDSGFKMCDMFTGGQMCEQAIEDLLCAVTCNPDAGNYTRVTADATTMSVCSSYAEFFFGVCQGISIGAIPLSTLITSSESFLNAITASVMKAIGYSNFNIVVEKEACFSGSQLLRVNAFRLTAIVVLHYGTSHALLAAAVLSSHLLVTLVTCSVAATPPAAPASPSGATANVCPVTKLPPTARKTPSVRCPVAATASCCADCADVSAAQMMTSANLSAVLTNISPSLGGLVEPSVKVCDLFVGQPECPFLVEAIVCGANCNPDSGSYVNNTKDGTSVMLICPKFADRIFSACKGIKLGSYVLSDLIADAQAFIDVVIVNTVKLAGVPNLNVTVSNSTKCFEEPALATTSPCDAAASIPPTCTAPGGSTTSTPPPAPPPPKSGAYSVVLNVVAAASIGLFVISALRKHTDAYLDCHLMVTDPFAYVEPMKQAGASSFTFHVEAVPGRAQQLVAEVHAAGMRAGVAIKPSTPVESVLPLLEGQEAVDVVLVMTVEPGFGGQAFMPDMMPKVQFLRSRFPNLDIQVDGGLGPSTIAQAAEAGANCIVAGSSVFGASDPAAAIAVLRDAVLKAQQGSQ